ncbi:MAG: sugar ABC transporter substrate-binding protein [Chloroflexi bacterium]|nr:sugar ABC transporter substrate-binding protein [Chloroflexota bacterium]
MRRVSRRRLIASALISIGSIPLLAGCASQPAAPAAQPPKPTAPPAQAATQPAQAAAKPTTAAQPAQAAAQPATAAPKPGATTAPAANPASADPDLKPYLEANIDWKQASGEQISLLVLPNFVSTDAVVKMNPVFEKLTGIKVNYQPTPPLQLREKHILDLSTKAGQFATTWTDPDYVPLYGANGWVDDLAQYLDNPKLTDKAWFKLDGIFPSWIKSTQWEGKQYSIPFDGATTIHVYRKDVFEQKGLKAPDTLDDLTKTAQALTDPSNNFYGMVYRGFRGPGQNMFIYPSLFLEFGGSWLDSKGKPTVNTPEGVKALTFYSETDQKYAPPGVENWNWPEEVDSFANGITAQFTDGSDLVAVLADPQKSKVVGKVGYARWPAGPTGKRVGATWNWSLPINSAVPEKTKTATWLYIQWVTSGQFARRTSVDYTEGAKRVGVNRTEIWSDPKFREQMAQYGPEYADVVLTTIEKDSDVTWRPRTPQWPKFGNIMAEAVQKALAKQASPKDALDEAQENLLPLFQ